MKHPDMTCEGRSFADTTDRFPDDALLRSKGYRIASRPKKGEAVWLSPDGELVPHSQAFRRIYGQRDNPIPI